MLSIMLALVWSECHYGNPLLDTCYEYYSGIPPKNWVKRSTRPNLYYYACKLAIIATSRPEACLTPTHNIEQPHLRTCAGVLAFVSNNFVLVSSLSFCSDWEYRIWWRPDLKAPCSILLIDSGPVRHKPAGVNWAKFGIFCESNNCIHLYQSDVPERKEFADTQQITQREGRPIVNIPYRFS